MNKPIVKMGEVIKVGKQELECVMVNYRERDGKQENFVYAFRSKAEVDQERKDSSNPEPKEEE